MIKTKDEEIAEFREKILPKYVEIVRRKKEIEEEKKRLVSYISLKT